MTTPIDVICPTCGSPPGTNCTTMGTTPSAPIWDGYHQKRHDAWAANVTARPQPIRDSAFAGALDECASLERHGGFVLGSMVAKMGNAIVAGVQKMVADAIRETTDDASERVTTAIVQRVIDDALRRTVGGYPADDPPDHSKRRTKRFEPGLGFCVCEHCAKLPEHDEIERSEQKRERRKRDRSEHNALGDELERLFKIVDKVTAMLGLPPDSSLETIRAAVQIMLDGCQELDRIRQTQPRSGYIPTCPRCGARVVDGIPTCGIGCDGMKRAVVNTSPLCARDDCGHPQDEHTKADGCTRRERGPTKEPCDCEAFVAPDLTDRIVNAVLQTLDTSEAWGHARRDPDAFRSAVNHVLGSRGDRIVELDRIRPVFSLARRWCNRPENVLAVGREVLPNDADMWLELRKRVAAAIKE